MVFICVCILGALVLAITGLRYTYAYQRAKKKRNTKIRQEEIDVLKRKYKKIGIIFAVFAVMMGGIRVLVIKAENRYSSAVNKIHVLESDPEKSLDEIFYCRDARKEYNQFEEWLHFEWIEEGLTMDDYRRKMSTICKGISEQENEDYGNLKLQEKQEIDKYAKKISILQDKKKNGETLTEEEMRQEYQAYWDSYNLKRNGEMAYQAGRAMEDLFSLEEGKKNRPIENVARSIRAFEEFLGYRDKTVGVGQEERTVTASEITYRIAKLYYGLAKEVTNFDVKRHLLLCAYGCAYNIYCGDNVLEADIYSLLGEYYKALAMIKLYDMYSDKKMLNKLEIGFYTELSTATSNIEIMSEFQRFKREEHMQMRISEVKERVKGLL